MNQSSTSQRTCSRPARLKLSRGQRRENSRKRQMVPKTTMSQDQEEDPEIQHWRETEEPDRVVTRDGVLLREWIRRGEPEQRYMLYV